MKAVTALCVSLVLGVLGVQGDDGLQARCRQVTIDFRACAQQAHGDYSKAVAAGDDGRPDFMARKSCNYLTAAVEGCGSKLVGECNTAEKVQELKEGQIKNIVARLQGSIQTWDSEKCPPVKSHFDRLKAAEEPAGQPAGEAAGEPAGDGGSDPVAMGQNEATGGETASDPEPEPTGGASVMALSGLLLGGLLLV